MADPPTARANVADIQVANRESAPVATGADWEAEDAYWQSAYPERPYARADRGYEYYRAAYRFGVEAAMRSPDRAWHEVERALRDHWALEHDSPNGAWAEMRDAVRDAWDHVRGESDDDRTHIR